MSNWADRFDAQAMGLHERVLQDARLDRAYREQSKAEGLAALRRLYAILRGERPTRGGMLSTPPPAPIASRRGMLPQ